MFRGEEEEFGAITETAGTHLTRPRDNKQRIIIKLTRPHHRPLEPIFPLLPKGSFVFTQRKLVRGLLRQQLREEEKTGAEHDEVLNILLPGKNAKERKRMRTLLRGEMKKQRLNMTGYILKSILQANPPPPVCNRAGSPWGEKDGRWIKQGCKFWVWGQKAVPLPPSPLFASSH